MKSLKINISLAILLFINFIFSFKYLSRITEFSIYISVFILLLQLIAFNLSSKINISQKQKNITCYGLIGFISSILIISHFFIPLETLKVDRWSVISSFLTELFNGNYPYYAQSHRGNYPGPMPIYYLIASPFYFIGELSILSSLGYYLLIFILKKTSLTDNNKFLFFYILTSFYLMWEITTRSNLFTFSILVLLALNEFINFENKNNLKFYILAILIGFMLSTRSIYILPYIVFFLSSLINKIIPFKNLVLFLFIALISFATTFVPFLIYFYDDFFVMNPFIIQSSFLIPKYYTLIFMFMAIGLAFLVKNKNDNFFFSGLILFIAILIYAIYHLVISGYEVAYLGSKIDISYFIFCIPFFIKYIMDNDKAQYNPDSKI